MEIKLPNDVLMIIEKMRARGFRCDVVGGSVRNSLLGISVDDYDLTTNALPQQVKEVFADYRTVDTGIKHGTVTLLIEGRGYEITTYRIDGDYTDNRHPDSVCFTELLSLDLERRDFTVNAMCYNPYDGFTDLFGGVRDLQSRLIRAVGDPERRFTEDALRILRALRFASLLDFTIERKTAEAIRAKAHLLKEVAPQRIFAELLKLFSGKGAYPVIEEFKEVLQSLFTELPKFSICDRQTFDGMKREQRLLSMFILSSGDACSDFDSFMKRYHSDNRSRLAGNLAIKAYYGSDFNSVGAVLKSFLSFGKDAVSTALELGIHLGRFTNEDAQMLCLAVRSGLPYTVSGLSVCGDDLVALGIKGRAIGDALDKLLDAVIRGRVQNDKTELIEYAKSFTFAGSD